MFVNKIGYSHLEMGNNCQDYGGIVNMDILGGQNLLKVVCDGCSEGKHSEVGAKLYTHLRLDRWTMDPRDIMVTIANCIGYDSTDIKNFMSFTILEVREKLESFSVQYCGDGFIIMQDHDDNITFEEINDGEFPKYFAYNWVEKEHLTHYKDGVSFTVEEFPYEQYKNVGIASDGIRFIVNCPQENLMLRDEFIDILKSGKDVAMKRFINRNHALFKDDVTIAF